MRSGMKNSYLVSLIGVAAMCFGSDCFAAAFGDSAIVGATYVVSCVGPNPNAGSVLISIPFSVSASSRLFGTGTITTHDKYFARIRASNERSDTDGVRNDCKRHWPSGSPSRGCGDYPNPDHCAKRRSQHRYAA